MIIEAAIVAEAVKVGLDAYSYSKKAVDFKRKLEEVADELIKKTNVRKKDRLIKGLLEFNKNGIIDEKLKDNVHFMSADEWEDCYESVTKVLCSGVREDLGKATFCRYLTIALLDKEISKDDYYTIMEILERLPSGYLTALHQDGILYPGFVRVAGPYLEKLFSNGILLKSYELDAYGSVNAKYDLSALGRKILQIVRKMKVEEQEHSIDNYNSFVSC